MTRRISLAAVVALAISVYAVLAVADSALACGGFFCQNSPVDQNAERIIFTQNKDGTVSAYIQIQYTGSAPGFSWILPRFVATMPTIFAVFLSQLIVLKQ